MCDSSTSSTSCTISASYSGSFSCSSCRCSSRSGRRPHAVMNMATSQSPVSLPCLFLSTRMNTRVRKSRSFHAGDIERAFSRATVAARERRMRSSSAATARRTHRSGSRRHRTRSSPVHGGASGSRSRPETSARICSFGGSDITARRRSLVVIGASSARRDARTPLGFVAAATTDARLGSVDDLGLVVADADARGLAVAVKGMPCLDVLQ